MIAQKFVPLLALGLAVAPALAGCQADAGRVIVDTSDGQPLPQAYLSGGASQATILRSITVAAGRPTKLNFFTFTNPDCTNVAYAEVRPLGEPANGTLEIKQIEDFAFWPERNPRSACNKTRVKGVVVRYVPKPDFVGIDTVAYEVLGPSSGLRRFA